MHSKLIGIFERIFGFQGREKSLMHLEFITGNFAKIPYENLTKIIMADDIHEDTLRIRRPEQVLEDYARWGAGGTCFSLSFCLKELLEAFGYQVFLHIGHLGGGRNNHCALTVRFQDRDFLLDPGYLIARAVRIPEAGDVLIRTPVNRIRLERSVHAESLHLSTIEKGIEKHRYELLLAPCEEDVFMEFWRDSFSWPMMNSILVSAIKTGGRLYLHDRYMRFFSEDGKHKIAIPDHYDERVADITGIHPDIIRKARIIVARIKPKLRKG